jgi:hypothetical protein
VGRIIGRYKVGKHFSREVGEGSFSYRRDQAKIEAEAVLDGLYVDPFQRIAGDAQR